MYRRKAWLVSLLENETLFMTGFRRNTVETPTAEQKMFRRFPPWGVVHVADDGLLHAFSKLLSNYLSEEKE
jgi:hypothetical protein